MNAPNSAKPATAETVSGLPEADRLGQQISFIAKLSSDSAQVSSAISQEFALNAREVMRAEVGEFNGRKIINIRRWFRSDDGSLRPTPKGVACALHHLPALAELVNGVLARARADGLLPEDKRGLA